MRNSLIKFISNEAKHNKSLYLLTGDLGFGVFDEFSKEFPDQFINVGIAEQNMTTIACGLALEGNKVYTYSIGNFSTLRCLEQIRNDICYHDVNVTVITVGAGFSYGQLGVSHFATEDISIIRTLPNISILSPSDSWEFDILLEKSKSIKGPKYFRIDKSNSNAKNENPPEIGIPRLCFDGEDGIIFATGGIVGEAIQAAKELKLKNISIKVFSVHTLKPIHEKNILKIIKDYKFIFTLEEHTIVGGLGSIIAEIISESNLDKKIFKRFGIEDQFPSIVGDQIYLRKYFKIDHHSISKEIEKIVKE
tara:strand:+ start:1282 stop:2199 length:918 start_codon:yes stop_codon:yes gene_type:complete